MTISPILLSKSLAIFMLAIALMPHLPYGYYVLLRWVLCGVFSYLLVSSFQKKSSGWITLYAILAGIYNPFIPAHLGRTIWVVVNVATIGLIFFSFWFDPLKLEVKKANK